MQRKREENLTLLNITKDEVSESATASNCNKNGIDSGTALQYFLDSIPICSIPGITNSSSSVVENRVGYGVGDAIRALNDKNVLGGLIADEPDAIIADDSIAKFMNNNPSNRYIGFIDSARLFLWSLEECRKECHQISGDKSSSSSEGSFFYMLDQNPDVSRTKIVALAKSFIWHPFLPVQPNDTLFHVLLLFSKHRPEFLPVVDQSSGNVTGFVTESGVIHLLLKSCGLEWFDQIAEKPLHDFRFDHAEQAIYVFGNQSIDEAIEMVWKNRDIGVVAVIQRVTKRLIGWVRRSDIHLLLDNHDLFHSRKSIPVEQFIQMSPEVEDNSNGEAIMGSLTLRNNFLPKMDSPATSRKTDTLKHVMESLAKTKSSFCLLLDESEHLEGVVTVRDIMLQFAPPSMDSRITGGSFFEMASE